MDSVSPKVLILYASYGDGHYQASKAIEACLHQVGIHDVLLLDLMAEAHPIINELTKYVYMQSFTSIPHVYGWVYNTTKEMHPTSPLSILIHSLGIRKLKRYISTYQPNLIVHTFPQLVMPKIRRQTGIEIPIVNVVTDFDLHGRWIHPDIDRYYVATEELRQQIIQKGIPSNRVIASGIPIRTQFNSIPFSVNRFRRTGKKNVLLMGGAFGVVQGIRKICDHLLTHTPFELNVVCGRNKELYNELNHLFGTHPNIQIHGYVDQISHLMQASDCIVTKPGGITLSESMACGLPLFLYRPVPGQELNNALFLQKKGVAFISHEPRELTSQVMQVLNNNNHLHNINSHMQQLVKPHAAERIVEDMINHWYLARESVSIR
ncbi:glycosyltransferase [Paenibacillus sediminis]|uniref:Processive 1,2-diacylglycerol beta-glucosyltransferase n=1 Tax=Paenibacillus sediminis TaxID=664909 RepID=A0ABS4H7P4_9BACL|nr:glycosyltransferase [Paenibacillus sediminis]MBP1938552.1 processive 1,2-diacylglycerol beta-glucosyltransferase [Paenibacillus sediminis]